MKSSILFATLFLILLNAISQTLVKDFAMPIPYTNPEIEIVKVDSDDKVLLYGDFDLYDDNEIPSLIRLNADGSLDESFNSPITTDIRDIDFLSTGEILILVQDALYKLDNSGTIIKELQENFSILSVIDDQVYLFSSNNELTRLDANLEIDENFKQDNEFSAAIYAIEKQGDEKIIVAGAFDQINGVSKNDVARFDLNGNLDLTFDAGSGTDEYLNTIVVQPDNKILLTESFINNFNGTQFQGLVRLNEDGDLDVTFSPPLLNSHTGSNVFIHDDKILMAEYYTLNSTRYSRVLKLNMDGSIFSSFELETPSNQIALNSDGDILVNTEITNGIRKYSQEGIIDNEFNPPLERIGYFNNAKFFEDFIIVTGDFFRLGSVTTSQIAKIDFLGNVDDQFIISEEINAPDNQLPVDIKVKSENEIYITNTTSLFKLNSSGELLEPFIEPLTIIRPYGDTDPNPAHQIEFLTNGKIVMKGPNGTYLLNEDGTQDQNFEVTSDIGSSAFDLAIQSDDYIIIGSRFNEINEVATKNIVKINGEGVVDQEFVNNAGTGASAIVKTVQVLSDDQIIIDMFGFGSFSGTTNNLGLFKLSKSGVLDQDFNTNVNATFESQIGIRSGDLHKGESYLFGYFTDEFKLGKMDYSGQINTQFGIDAADNAIGIDPSSIYKPVSSGEKHFIVLGTFELDSDETEALLFIDNEMPIITTVDDLTTPEETPILISLDNLTIEDPDNVFPNEFTLTLLEGDNYTLSESQVIPAIDFNGTLTVPVIVNDGVDDSPIFELAIEVSPINDAPQIVEYTGTVSIPENGFLDLSLADFIILDSDNVFPDDFTLSIQEGTNYQVNENQISPNVDFIGSIDVSVNVNDGELNSDVYTITIEITEVLGLDNEFIKDKFSIYPNPTTDFLTVSSKDLGKYQISILTLQGNLVYHAILEGKSTESLNLTELPQGVYLLKIYNDDKIGAMKFVVTKN